MKMSLTRSELYEYVGRQLDNFFPDKFKFGGKNTKSALDLALDRLEYCYKRVSYRHYCVDGEVEFRHLYSDQYCQFLYFYSNSLWKEYGEKVFCDKIINLNKTLNGILCPYTVNLPDIFIFVHPVGTVLGNAFYSNYLVVMQNVGVNYANGDNGLEPLRLGRALFLSTGAKIIGNQPIGDRVSIGVNTVVHNKRIPSDMVYFDDDDGRRILKPRKKPCFAQNYFNELIE